MTGAQPLSFRVSGAIVTDCTHFAPEQSLPAAIETLSSQSPSHPVTGSNAVCGVVASVSAHDAAFAVTVAGSSHDPAGASQLHAPHVAGAAIRSA